MGVVNQPIAVEIDELLLDGVAPGQEAEIAAALRDELERRLGAFAGPAALHLAEIGPVLVPEGAAPAEIGRRIALSVTLAALRATAPPPGEPT